MEKEAQQAIDELYKKNLIPLELTARLVHPEGHGIYTIHFFDARLRSLSVFWREGQSFRDVTRDAVLKKCKDLANTSAPELPPSGDLVTTR